MNKKVIILISSVVVVLIICLIIILPKGPSEKDLTKNMEKLGSFFYEQFYYPHQEETQQKNGVSMNDFLAPYSTTGFKVDLENIAKVSGVDKKLVNSMKNCKKECNKKNTFVTIYPKEPYGVKDYEIKVNLDCGFKK